MKKSIAVAALFLYGISFAQENPKNDSTKVENIQEVMISKKVFTRKADRFVYDISQASVAKGNTVFSVLAQTPMVSSTDDKTLKIVGKNNAVIYINGRKSTMDSESLGQFLKSTPAENIQKIEVITVPGSEYNVESSDGIINIILKKKSTNGFNGNLQLRNRTDYWNSQNASVSLNYRKDKLGISASVMGSENIQEQYYLLKNGNASGSNQSEGHVSDPNKNLGGYVNIDYELNDKSNLALNWNTWANRSYGSVSEFLNTVNGNIYTKTLNNENARTYNNSLNLNYELKTDSLGSKLNLNAAYLNYRRFQNADNRTYFSDSYGHHGDLMQQFLVETPQIINSFSFLADYVQKFQKDFTVSFGGNFSNTQTDNDTRNDSFNYLNHTTSSNPNHFVYDENIYGIYLTLEKKFSDKFSGKIGSRYEITGSTGTSDNVQNPELSEIKRKYNNFLPYLSINYSVNDNHNISYAFSSRMRRPSFWELNPVIQYLTNTNYTQNNPFVKASSIYSNELTYMFKNSYFLVLSHSYLKDQITQVPLQGEINGVNQLRYIRTNFGDAQQMSAMLGMNRSFFKGYLNTNFNIGMQRNINNGTLSQDPITGDVFPEYTNRRKSNSFLIQTSNTVQLDKAKTWFLGVNYWYMNKQQVEIGLLQGLGSLDLNLKKVWNSWTFMLEATDLLRNNIVILEDTQTNGNYNYIYQDGYRRGLNVSITYSFGNQKVKKVRKIETADEAIKSRTR